ncbi:hypothetical protein PAAG_01077 [Paracoccidioides lutzii Pb01]|uniref:Uncharacterized protein n=1 Tax=Paracoccidioides lutzii (strain ATCC MYA-826 / Pb01) TaxID=502779 RepID=C1GRD2_PARBA|nr:hypothetical protein PAAG_01077 [Paracoccidioides lutzii Pb01]EEH38156.1 hypothetical protein PAAG_01077 [Paracoccidioides lutzii Pb01]
MDRKNICTGREIPRFCLEMQPGHLLSMANCGNTESEADERSVEDLVQEKTTLPFPIIWIVTFDDYRTVLRIYNATGVVFQGLEGLVEHPGPCGMEKLYDHAGHRHREKLELVND